ncbi:MAG TPA: hypothetical protein VEH50_08600 [Methylomirabilota bacterium]|jgi:hypothetical protein|nr:hypothetical protein [Methylomirabilota bacterium]
MDNQRIRQTDSPKLQSDVLAEPEGMEALREARKGSRALLRAADDVIKRVLSRNSEQFLEEARQHGGQ